MSIRLIEPVKGAVTRPLQRFCWPTDEELEGGGEETMSAPRDSIDPNRTQRSEIDRSFPEAVLFVWQSSVQEKKPATYDLLIARRRDFSDARVVGGLDEPHAEVLHLHIATRYFWKVISRRKGRAPVESPVESFTTHPATPRWIAVPGITNVRDMGGWPLPDGRRVRQGLVYRSSEMNGHVVISDEGKRILTDELHIRTDLDLRAPPEEVMPVLDQARVEWINIPVLPYAHIGEKACQEGYRRVFELFADETKYPLLFHCWGGADRAGTVAFLLSALLGKSRENLVRDYELTSLSIWGLRSRRSVEFKALLATLAPYDESGNINRQVENFLLSAGLSEDQLGRIRKHLIENAPA